jgi:hypothetical protein
MNEVSLTARAYIAGFCLATQDSTPQPLSPLYGSGGPPVVFGKTNPPSIQLILMIPEEMEAAEINGLLLKLQTADSLTVTLAGWA